MICTDSQTQRHRITNTNVFSSKKKHEKEFYTEKLLTMEMMELLLDVIGNDQKKKFVQSNLIQIN